MALPVANFTFLISGLVVAFTDGSLNAPVSWSWDFGDSTTSNIQNPSHTYLAAGTYTVKLTVTNADGSSSVTSVVAIIPPVASFTFSPQLLQVSFSSTSTGNPSITTWDFGDGATSNLPNPTHTYATPGQYTVTDRKSVV